MTLLSLAALSMMGPYQYVLADWQLAYRALSSAQDRDQCLQAACGSSSPSDHAVTLVAGGARESVYFFHAIGCTE